MLPTVHGNSHASRSDTTDQPSQLRGRKAITDTSATVRTSHHASVENVEQNHVALPTGDVWLPAVTDDSCWAKAPGCSTQHTQVFVGDAAYSLHAADKAVDGATVSTARSPTCAFPLDARLSHQVHDCVKSPGPISGADLTSNAQKRTPHSALSPGASPQSNVEGQSSWNPRDFPPLTCPTNDKTNHAEVAVASRIPIPRPGYYTVYAAPKDRFNVPRNFPPGENSIINKEEVGIASKVPVPGGILKGLGAWNTGARVTMSFPTAARLFKRNDPPNETLFQHQQKQKGTQRVEDAACKEVRGKQLADSVASGEHVVPKSEVIDGSTQPQKSKARGAEGKQRKCEEPTLGELERETKRWLEYFINVYRGEESKCDILNPKKSILTKREILAIMRDAERYCKGMKASGSKDREGVAIGGSEMLE